MRRSTSHSKATCGSEQAAVSAWYLIRQFRDLALGQARLYRLVVDRDQIYRPLANDQVRDHTRTSRLTLALGADRDAQLVRAIPKSIALLRIMVQAFDKRRQILSQRGIAFASHFACRSKGGIVRTSKLIEQVFGFPSDLLSALHLLHVIYCFL